MDNLRAALVALFTKVRPQTVLDRSLNPWCGVPAGGLRLRRTHPGEVGRGEFLAATGFDGLAYLTDDEIDLVRVKAQADWMRPTQCANGREGESHPLYLIQRFAEAVLQIGHDKDLCCSFEHLLRWREVSFLIGEDPFTTAYHAFHDILARQDRVSFCWRPILRTDHHELHQILSQGIAENHFHLKGSSQHFELSWLRLMNDVTHVTGILAEIESRRVLFPQLQTSVQEHQTLQTLVFKAATIRFLLYLKTMGHDNREDLRDWVNDILLGGDGVVDIHRHTLESAISAYRYHSLRFGCRRVDYAIDRDVRDLPGHNLNYFFHGERKILYGAFQGFFRGEDTCDYETAALLWAYLLIRFQLRKELMQVNERPGFGNFSEYERRKETLIEGRIYQDILPGLAIQNSLENQDIRSMEARICPDITGRCLSRRVRDLDHRCGMNYFAEDRFHRFLRRQSADEAANPDESRFFYVTHFVRDSVVERVNPLTRILRPRNAAKRREVRRQAHAIADLRQERRVGCDRIFGIDACNSELCNRPEVFAQAFRFLRLHEPRSCGPLQRFNQRSVPQLGMTYHAGEDFYGIVDGLRAIDEALLYMGLRKGDRLGHALALGVDPVLHYRKRHNRIVTTKQYLLDDLAWTIDRIHRQTDLRDHPLKEWLCDCFDSLFREVYKQPLREDADIARADLGYYVNAWKLRGDDPMQYFDPEIAPSVDVDVLLTYWGRCALNRFVGRSGEDEFASPRNDITARKLYNAYHFRPDVRRIGEEITEFDIHDEYPELVRALQAGMQVHLAKHGIGLEICPSSNFVLGRFGHYSRHPLTKYYNLGLTADPDEIRACNQLSISINTDDQGVFGTYLENEYALMALALEKTLHPDGSAVYNRQMILDWLDRIRKLGLQQSFRRNSTRSSTTCPSQ